MAFNRRRGTLTAITVAVLMAISACAAARTSPSAQTPSVSGGTAGSTVSVARGTAPSVPSEGAYLGAWINPKHSTSSAAAEIAQLPTVRDAGAAPAILALYTPWQAAAPIAAMRDIAAQGALPLVAWGCSSTSAIASGADDAQITAYAQAMRTYGKPVFLRWFWEMNLPTRAHAACLGSDGGTGFVAAWKHLRAVFDRVGATNVAFVWCPGVSGGTQRMAEYFPGAEAVDWIAADGYATSDTADIGTVFEAWYHAYASEGRPMMIAETGARSEHQAAYLSGAAQILPARLPDVKALVYFDAPGKRGNWVLGGAGLAAYADLSHQHYFAAHSA